ncbi:MAG: exodeoxyribonuclease V subunit alpha [Acidimicrobiales bacterium]
MIRIDRPAGVDGLEPFVVANVLGPTEIEVVTTLARVTGESDPCVLLALALAVRGPLLGHVCVDLATVADTVVVERPDPDAPGELTWPDAGAGRSAVAASPLTRTPGAVLEPGAPSTDGVAEPVEGVATPLVLDGTRLYLDRYWRYEQALVQAILDRSAAYDGATHDGADGADGDHPAGGTAAPDPTGAAPVLDRLFGPLDVARPDRQRAAAESAIAHRLTVIAGGPGTGKTRTVARLLAVLEELAHARGRPLDIRLAAPTGKAAARMTEAIVEQVGQADVSDAVRDGLLGTTAVTLHRLLGSDGRGGFRHGAADPLPADVVVIDETSMVSLPLMAHLFDALRPEARIVLVGDPSQLASVEAGAVLGDLVGSSVAGRGEGPGPGVSDDGSPLASPLDGHPGIGVVVLDRVHRFEAGSPIAGLAAHVRAGDADAVVGLLTRARPDELRWIDPDDAAACDALALEVVDHARRVLLAARAGRAEDALAELAEHAVLSATRLGPTGVTAWNQQVERRLAADPAFDVTAAWYPGRPIIVTANDYLNQVSNGDVGVTVVNERPQVAFPAGDGVRLLDPSRLDRIETWWAMTIHKSQGSEFGHVVVVLPPPPSAVLTRELLYTAVTRARSRVSILASEPAIRAAIDRPVSRASGLAERLRLAAPAPVDLAPSIDEAPPDDGPLTLF